MLERIYASQFYKYSNRQANIKSAIQNPLNKVLVTQLADALDKKYQTKDYLLDEDDQKKLEKEQQEPEVDESEVSEDNDAMNEESKSSHPAPTPHSSSNHSASDKLNDEKKELHKENMENHNPSDSSLEAPSAEVKKESAPTSSESKDTSAVAESTQVNAAPVFSSTIAHPFKDLHQECDQVKNLLNFNSDTSGVSRVMVKEDEFQVFYNDDVNLNNVMDKVIEMLNSAGYTYLEFNRLARSQNAIIFIINPKDSDNRMKATLEVVDQK